LLTEIGLTPGGSSTVRIYTQTIHRTTQLTNLVGRYSGIRTQIDQTKTNFYIKTNRVYNFFSSLLNITVHVSDGLSVHHQESKTVHTASGICHTG